MLELYEQNRVPPSQGSELEGSGGASHRISLKAPPANEEHVTSNSYSQAGGTASKPGTSKSASSRPVSDLPYADNHVGRATQSQSNEYGSTEMKSGSDHKADGESQDYQHPEPEALRYQGNMGEAQNLSRFGSEGLGEENRERNVGRSETREAGELKDKHLGRNLEYREGTLSQSPQEVIKKIDKDKLKAALEKRKKFRGDTTRKADLMDEDDLIERELEDGIELAAENEKIKRERRQSWSKPSNRLEDEHSHYGKHQEDAGDGHHRGIKRQSSHGPDLENSEEGEVSVHDDASRGLRSPKSSNRKRKVGSPPDKTLEGKQRHDYMHGSHNHNHHDHMEDRNRLGRVGYSDRDHKRHLQENHV